MKIGDLVKLKERDDLCECCVERTGVILNFRNHHPDDSAIVITVAEVLWDDRTKWVDVSEIVLC